MLLAALGASGLLALFVQWLHSYSHMATGEAGVDLSPTIDPGAATMPWITIAVLGAAVLAAAVVLGFRYLHAYRFASDFARRATQVADFNQARLLDFVELSSDWLWESDIEGRFTLVSSGIRSIANMDPATFTGLPPWALPDDETDPNAWRAVRKHMANQERFTVLMTRRDLAGERRHLEFIGKPLFEADAFRGYRGIGRDVTYRIDAEAELRESESRFRSLIETFFDWYWEQDAQFRYTRWLSSPHNPQVIDEQHVLGHTRWSLLGAEPDAPEWIAHVSLLREHKPFDNFIYQRPMDDGRMAWFSVTGRPIFDNSGRFTGYRGVARDVTQEQETRRALVDSEARYRNTFEMAPVGITTSSPDGRLDRVNPAFARMIGYAPEALVGRHVRTLTHPDDADEDATLFAALREGAQETFAREKRYIHQGGRIVWAAVRVTALREDDGSLGACIGIIQDITARVEAEQRRHAVEERYRRLVDVSPDGIIVHRDGRILFGNRAAVSIFGVTSLEALIGAPLERFYVDPLVPPSGASTLSPGTILPLRQRRIRRRESELRDVEVTSVVVQFDDGPAILSVVRDVSERVAAQQALAQSRALYKDVVESINEVIFQTDAAGCFTFLNPAWSQTTGFAIEDSLGQPLTAFGHPDDRASVLGRIDPVLSGAQDQCNCELRIKTQDGELRWLEAHARTIRHADGRVIGMMGSLDDITPRKVAELTLRNINMELEARVRARTADLEASNRELEAFSYSVSHDLRAPLRAIDGFSVILQEDLENSLDETARTYLKRIRTASARMAQLIDDLIELARLTRQPLRRQNIDLSQMVREALAEVRQSDPDRVLVTDITPGLTANADPRLMRVVIDNLVRNAWKFSAGKAQTQISFFATRDEDEVSFCIEDNGVGFDMAYSSKLFVPFYRLHANSEFEGSGIGLATVARIIQRHGGTISANAIVGEGARFCFSIGH